MTKSKKLTKREQDQKHYKNFKRSVEKLTNKYNPCIIYNIDGLTDYVPDSVFDEMTKNYQEHMKNNFNQNVEPKRIPEVKVGEVDPRNSI